MIPMTTEKPKLPYVSLRH